MQEWSRVQNIYKGNCKWQLITCSCECNCNIVASMVKGAKYFVKVIANELVANDNVLHVVANVIIA